jgi:bifunctional DNA-binding transcriptional regulator/antitoxin component of YhaV-PrlF toxin-antitoxin module
MLGLKKGDVVDIAVDGGEYYLYKKYDSSAVNGRHEGKLCYVNQGIRRNGHLRTFSVTLCKAMLSLTKCEDSVRLPMGSAAEYGQIGLAAPIVTRNIL